MTGIRGRRLPDVALGSLPEAPEPGDFWKYVDPATGRPVKTSGSPRRTNLTGTVWGFYSPDGNGIGTLMSHTVREHADGSISVEPGDGSSNSILHTGGAEGKTWHGYVYHGEWVEV